MPDPQIITLPSGGTITLLSFTDLRGKLRGVVTKAILNAGDTSNDAAAISAIEALAPHLIVKWDIPYLGAIEKTDVFDLLEPLDWEVVRKAITPALDVLYPAKVTPDDAGKPGTPTQPDGD